LSDVCLSVAYIGPNSRTERPRKTKISTEVAHVTGDSDTTFKVKGQGHQAALLSATLTRKAAAAVSVGTYSAWESTVTLRLLGGARGAWAHTGRRGAGAYCVATRTTCYFDVVGRTAIFLTAKNGFLALVLPNLNQSGYNFAHTYYCTEYTCGPTRSARERLQAEPKSLCFFCNTCNAP